MSENDPLEQLETRIIRKVYVWLVVGALGIGGVGGSGILRYGKFTQTDFQLAKDELEEQMEKEHKTCRENIEQYISRELNHAVILLENKMPPHNTRIRIHAIERYIEQQDPTYTIPTQAW